MRSLENVDITKIEQHLISKHSGVGLEREWLPGGALECHAHRAHLDHDDIDRIFLWWQFSKHSRDETSKLTSVLPKTALEPRVQSFILGDPSRNLKPLDLQTAVGFELVLLTTNLPTGPLYLIDGNHRAVAHFLQGRSFMNVAAFVLSEPRLLEWANVPDYVRRYGKSIS
jgi:hypothetical protein